MAKGPARGAREVLRRGGLALAAAALAAFAWARLPLVHAPGDVCTSPLIFPGEMLLHHVASVVSQAMQFNQRMPGLGLLHALLAEHWRAERAASAAAAFALLCAVGALAGGGAAAGVAAAALLLLLSAVFPENAATAAWHGPDDLEAVYAVLVLAVAAAAAWRARRPTAARSLLAGAVLGGALLYRSTPALLPLWWLAADRLRPPRERAAWKATAALCATPLLFLLPWLALNLSAGQGFVPFEKGETSYLIVAGALGLVERTTDWRALAGPAVASGRVSDAAWWAAAQVLGHPLRFLLGVAGRAWFIVRLHPLLLALAAAGAWRARRRPAAAAVALVAVYHIVMHSLLGVAPEYFQALWPLAAALAAQALVPEDEGRARWAETLAAAAACVVVAFALWTESVVVRYAASLRSGAGPRGRLDAALAASPGDGWLRLERGTLSLREGRLVEAERDLAAAREALPRCAQLETELAWTRALEGRTEEFRALVARPGWRADSLDEKLMLAHGLVVLGRSLTPEQTPARADCWRAAMLLAARPRGERRAFLRAVPACADAWPPEEAAR